MTHHGYTVVVAQHGAHALEIVRKRPPTLILSDIAMPVMDGYAMCHVIKSDPALQDIPIILLTALSRPRRHYSRPEREGRQLPHETLRRGDTACPHRTSAGESHAPRKEAKFQLGVEIFFAGKKHLIDSDRRHTDILISTFEDAVQHNRGLIQRTQALQTSEDSYRALLENTFSGFYLATDDGHFLEVNPAYVQMLGYARKENMLSVEIPTTLYTSQADYEAFRSRLLAAEAIQEATGRLRQEGWQRRHRRNECPGGAGIPREQFAISRGL